MPKIQNVGIGNFIRSPRARRNPTSRGMNIEILQVVSSQGNSFQCHPVTSVDSGNITIDMTRYQMIAIDTWVDQVKP